MYFLTAEEKNCDREKIPQSKCLYLILSRILPMNAAAVGENLSQKIELKLMKEKHNLFTRKNHIVE
jgi:hypothetical protein